MCRVSRSTIARPTSLFALAGALLVLAFACDRGTVPAAVEFALRGGFPADGVLHSDTGIALQLRSAKLSVLAVELRPCATAAQIRLREVIAPSRAFAHSVGAATRLGVPNVIDLLAPTTALYRTIARGGARRAAPVFVAPRGVCSSTLRPPATTTSDASAGPAVGGLGAEGGGSGAAEPPVGALGCGEGEAMSGVSVVEAAGAGSAGASPSARSAQGSSTSLPTVRPDSMSACARATSASG